MHNPAPKGATQSILARRQAHSVGRCHAARDVPRRALRIERLRGAALLRDPRRTRDLPARRSHAPPDRLVQDLPDPHQAFGRDARAGLRRYRGRERHPPRLSAPGRRAHRRTDGRLRRGHPGGDLHHRLALGPVPRRRCAQGWRGHVRLQLAPRRARHLPGARQGRRQLPQRLALQDGGPRRQVRRGDHARRDRPHRRRGGGEHVPGARQDRSTRRRSPPASCTASPAIPACGSPPTWATRCA